MSDYPMGYGPFVINLKVFGRLKDEQGNVHEIEFGGDFGFGVVPTPRKIRQQMRKMLKTVRESHPGVKLMTSEQMFRKLMRKKYGPIPAGALPYLPGSESFRPWPKKKPKPAPAAST